MSDYETPMFRDDADPASPGPGPRPHRHRWIDNTRIEDAGTRYVCACGATYFEPLLPRDPGPDKLYYVKEG